MSFLNDVSVHIFVAFLALGGFLIAKHIRNHKTKNMPLICPAKFDCHAVVHSDYSKFMNVPLEILGMIYYSLIFLAYLVLIFIPNILPVTLTLFLVLLSMGAFLFSVYLIAVQIFILKKGCSWCFVSAFISILIFVLTIFTYDITPLMQNLAQ